MKAINRKPSRKRPAPARIGSKQKATGPTSQRTSVRLDRRTRDAIIRLSEALRRDNEPSEPPYYLETHASDPIPENAIGFYDAFYRTWEAAQKSNKPLELDQDDREEIRRCTESGLKQFLGEYSQEDLEDIAMGKEVNLFLRKCITEGELVACVRDPETGDILQLRRHGWDITFYPEEWGFVLYDHVHPDDVLNPGPPDVIVRGMARPVFFLRDKFEQWLQKSVGSNTSKRGRKRGSGSMERIDEPFLLRMKKLIDNDDAKSAHDAAGQVVDDKNERPPPGASPESTKTRLAKRYRKRFPSEHN
jgi:hypothetical protein